VNGICLLVAGVVRATLPGPEVTLAWDHSVEKIEWREQYRVDGERLRPTEARIRGSGAGMEAPPGAIRSDGAWVWRPDMPPLPELRLTHSTYTRDYRLCDAQHCTPLAEVAGPLGNGDVVTVRACPVIPPRADPAAAATAAPAN
jgi:hypothetical protein